MAESSIEWTDATWNPVAGCTAHGRAGSIMIVGHCAGKRFMDIQALAPSAPSLGGEE